MKLSTMLCLAFTDGKLVGSSSKPAENSALHFLMSSKSSEPDAEWQFEGNGLIHAYLAGAKNEAFPTVKTLQTGTKPKYNTMDDVLEKFGDKYKYLTVNKGKKCPRCAKPCAYTLGNCNDCSQDLRNVEVSTTENVFMAFVFGVKKGPFPYTISLRSESKRYMVIDDLLATAPMHLLVIPTFSWIPDFRHLFLAPERALVIIDEMEREGRKVMQEQFWENPDFKNKYWSTIEDMESLILPGLNFPPSQWHLHLQFLAPPTTPFYHNELQKGNFFHYRRFFHLKYVKEALKSALSQPLTKDISESPIEEVIQIFDERNISYDNIYNAEIKRWETMQKKCSAYHGEDFTRVVIEDTVVDMNLQKTGEDPKELQKRDKKMIQNYGRPYNGSLVSGTYYSFAKDPTDLEKWPPQTQA